MVNYQLCPHCPNGFGLKYPVLETARFWIVCDAHPLTEGHILIIPKAHISCMGALDDKLFAEYKELYQKVAAFLQKTYGNAAVFEHGIAGQTVFHAHAHFLPFGKSIKDIVPEKGSRRKIQMLEDVRTEFSKTDKYLFVALNNEMFLVDTKISFPRFFRDRFAAALDANGRSNWKKARDNTELMRVFKTDVMNLKKNWKGFFKQRDFR